MIANIEAIVVKISKTIERPTIGIESPVEIKRLAIFRFSGVLGKTEATKSIIRQRKEFTAPAGLAIAPRIIEIGAVIARIIQLTELKSFCIIIR